MLLVETNKPILSNPEAILKKISVFWDSISTGWEKIWGPHIHHGYYDDPSDYDNTSDKKNILSNHTPQERLIQKLVESLDLKKGLKILDVGCGMGGSSIYLAKNYDAKVQGISLSEKQISMARKFTENEKLKDVSFCIDNAHALASCEDNSFDLVWSLESCEQFYDKTLFMQQAYRVLKPGGKLMIATWSADKERYTGSLAKRYIKLCNAFDLPYMPTEQYYREALQKQFLLQSCEDWSSAVKNSWDLGIKKLKNYSWYKLLNLVGLRGISFARSLNSMSEAFLSGQIRYLVFVAVKK